MWCVKTRDYVFLKSYKFCIQFLEIYSLFKPMGTRSEGEGQKESDTYISITDFIGLSTKSDVIKWYLCNDNSTKDF